MHYMHIAAGCLAAAGVGMVAGIVLEAEMASAEAFDNATAATRDQQFDGFRQPA